MRRQLATSHTRLGQHETAQRILLAVLDEYAASHTETARSHNLLSWTHGQRGEHRTALHHARQAVAGFGADGDTAAQARAMNAVGWYHILQGEYEQGQAACEQALTLLRPDDVVNLAGTWDSIGHAQHHLGRFEQAVGSYRRSLELYKNAGRDEVEAEVHDHLARSLHRLHRSSEARAAWATALTLYPDENSPEVAEIRARLAELDTAAPGPASPAPTGPS
nr:tetratricopeptide repeat protein [Streptomyces sp. SID4948]